MTREWQRYEARREEPGKEKPTIRCYQCGELGHIKSKCQKVEKKGNVMYVEKEGTERVLINGTHHLTIFDTGSDNNFINIETGKQLKVENKIKRCPVRESYEILNETELIIDEEMDLRIDYKGRSTKKDSK